MKYPDCPTWPEFTHQGDGFAPGEPSGSVGPGCLALLGYDAYGPLALVETAEFVDHVAELTLDDSWAQGQDAMCATMCE